MESWKTEDRLSLQQGCTRRSEGPDMGLIEDTSTRSRPYVRTDVQDVVKKKGAGAAGIFMGDGARVRSSGDAGRLFRSRRVIKLVSSWFTSPSSPRQHSRLVSFLRGLLQL